MFPFAVSCAVITITIVAVAFAARTPSARHAARLAALGGLVVAVFATAFASFSTVPTRNVGIVTQFNKQTGRTTGAGLQWHAPWQGIDDWVDQERRSKEALRVSERMSLAAESAQLALWDWDLAQDVVWVQDQGLFGFPPNVPIDHATLGGSVHPDDRAMREAAIQRALSNGGNYESEFRVILADGSVRWISARGRSPSPAAKGAPARILGIAIDTTGQKQAGAEAQVQREELAHLIRVATVSALSRVRSRMN